MRDAQKIIKNESTKIKNSDVLSVQQMRGCETAAIETGQTTGLALMETAGQGVVAEMLAHWPELNEGKRHAVVLCGPGNNGGDGFVIARCLAVKGWQVDVYLLRDSADYSGDARTNCDRWAGIGEVRVLAPQTITGRPDVLIDALFGTGLTRPMTDDLDPNTLFKAEPPVLRRVAVDIPSGLCADSGRRLGHAFTADLTVTFHAPKPGHFLAEGPQRCGRLVVVDIGLGIVMQTQLRLVDPPSPALIKRQGHKFSHGHALVLSGGEGRTGAARLAARGALRIGAGLVTIGAPPQSYVEVAFQVTAIMLRQIEGPAALSNLLEDARINAMCLGPGLGLDDRAAKLVGVALNAGRPLVLDADALTLLAKDRAQFESLHKGCVLTPHAGEFARLFPAQADRLTAKASRGPAFSKVQAAAEAAHLAGCTVLFKGPDTVIAGPDGDCVIQSPDPLAAWLATAGSGDVLAGFIAGLLARGFSPADAAEQGVVLHAACARHFGPGLIAEDLPEALPAVLSGLA